MKFVFLGGTVAAFVVMISYMVLTRPQPQIIAVDIRLNNTCDIASTDFVITNLKTGEYHPFRRGHARFDVLEGTPLKLELHPRYSKIEYDGTEFGAVPKMVVTSDCNVETRGNSGFEHLSRELAN